MNHLGGYTQVDSQLDFMGKTLATETRHKRLSGDSELLTKEEFTYSAQDRLLTHTHQINGGTKQLLAKNTYDELGQLIAKNVGGTDVTGTTSLQKVDYKYNIRGWLKEINDINNLTVGTNPQDLFAFKISYNDPATTSKALYNGNISETYWKTINGNQEKKYEYDYDNLYRLTNAKYFNNSNALENNSFNEILSYDKNGNILSLNRNEPMPSLPSYTTMDQLTYTYDTINKNQLKKVDENPGGTTRGFKNGINSGDDYAYDANGNMISDQNKGITSITYNHLNLPVKIEFGNNKIEYIYNATGQKLRKTVTENGIMTRTDYLGGYQYKASALEFFPHAEGYVKNTAGVYSYVFNYTDHLGNVRLSYTQNGSVLQTLEESNYYPFGLKHEPNTVVNNQPSYKYKYQGQERQDELGLNWDSFKWRNYDYAIGRFMCIDPLAMKYTYNSPYAFQENKMGMGVELEGLELVDWNSLRGKGVGVLADRDSSQLNGALRQAGINTAGRNHIINKYNSNTFLPTGSTASTQNFNNTKTVVNENSIVKTDTKTNVTVEIGMSGNPESSSKSNISVNSTSTDGTNSSTTVGGQVNGTVKLPGDITVGGNASASQTTGTSYSLANGVVVGTEGTAMQGDLQFKVTVNTTITTTTTPMATYGYGSVFSTVPTTTSSSTTTTTQSSRTVYSTPNENSNVKLIKIGQE